MAGATSKKDTEMARKDILKMLHKHITSFSDENEVAEEPERER